MNNVKKINDDKIKVKNIVKPVDHAFTKNNFNQYVGRVFKDVLDEKITPVDKRFRVYGKIVKVIEDPKEFDVVINIDEIDRQLDNPKFWSKMGKKYPAGPSKPKSPGQEWLGNHNFITKYNIAV